MSHNLSTWRILWNFLFITWMRLPQQGDVIKLRYQKYFISVFLTFITSLFWLTHFFNTVGSILLSKEQKWSFLQCLCQKRLLSPASIGCILCSRLNVTIDAPVQLGPFDVLVDTTLKTNPLPNRSMYGIMWP